MKRLEEMNLVDDFLVNSLTSHKIYGEESSRYILECILHRKIGKLTVVPQRFWGGENTEDHGVRLDVYLDEEDGEIFDIEPDKNDGEDDIASLPRRVRFYHAKIDAGNLAAGEDYSKLRNVIVIFITTYDPFGRERMVYTIQNGCVEEPDMPYEDGAKTLFLYTKGTKGNPPEELRQLLRYMENSIVENAQSEGLKSLHKMVTAVKCDGEVGLAYMKSFEREQRIKAEGVALGKAEGKAEGKADDILMLLSCKGEIPEELSETILGEKKIERLNAWLIAAAKAGSVSDFRKECGI